MSSLELLLRDAMTEHTAAMPAPRAGLAALVARRSNRVRRLQAAGVALSASALVVGGAAGVIALNRPGVSLTVIGRAAGGPSPVFPQVQSGKGTSPAAAKAAGDLEAVSLPDPAPGFPVRRVPNETAGLCGCGGPVDVWAKTFLVGVRPDAITDNHDGTYGGVPTGPEASVLVIDGQVSERYRVTGHVKVGGYLATVLSDEGRAALAFSAGRFAVEVWGDEGATVDQLVTLAESIRGLPSGS
jgi:hypothetical protein